MKRLFPFIGSLLDDMLDLLLPRICPSCSCRMVAGERGVCNSCLSKFPKVSSLDSTGDYVERLFWGRVPVVNAMALYLYDGDGIVNTIHQFKYFKHPLLADDMGRIMVRELLPTGVFDGVDAIVPVPLHPNRERQRGYNQSDHLACGIAAETGLPVWRDIVVRIVDNPTQTHISVEERQKNVQDIFWCRRPERIKGRHILVVDDVITTGATVVSVCQSMQKALGEDTDRPQYDGSSQVRFSILSLAYTDHHFVLNAKS